MSLFSADDDFVGMVVVKLKWTDQARFAGIYTADQKGYYPDNGVAVS